MHVSVLMVFGITLDPYSIPKSLRFNHPVDLKIGHPARLTAELRPDCPATASSTRGPAEGTPASLVGHECGAFL